LAGAWEPASVGATGGDWPNSGEAVVAIRGFEGVDRESSLELSLRDGENKKEKRERNRQDRYVVVGDSDDD
jgi:hypothetical protein